MLFLDDGVGGAVELDSTELANLVGDQRDLRLVVLNSCEGARTTPTDPFAGVATTLLSLDVPAVVAMQFPISDEAAILFAEELYTNLIGRQDPIDAAVAEGRKAIYIEMGGMEWATPVLFMADPRVELFQIELPAAPLPAPADPITGEVPVIAAVTGRARSNRSLVAAIAGAAAVVIAIVAAVVFWPSEDQPTTGTTVGANGPAAATIGDWDGARFDVGEVAGTSTLLGQRTIALDRLSVSVDGSLHDADDFTEEPVEYWWTTSPFTNQGATIRRFLLHPDVDVLALDPVGDEAACTPGGSDANPVWQRAKLSDVDDRPSDVASLTYSEDGLVELIRLTHGCDT